jgi:hypothetical protein
MSESPRGGSWKTFMKVYPIHPYKGYKQVYLLLIRTESAVGSPVFRAIMSLKQLPVE